MGLLERWARPFSGFGAWLAKLTNGIYRSLGFPGRLFQDLMNGSFLGHSTHGLLTDAAVGAVTALLVLDAVAVVFGADGSGFETASLVVLGFGALELNLVYPILAAAYTYFCAPKYLRGTLPMFAVSLIYVVVHNAVAPLTAPRRSVTLPRGR